MHHLLLRLQQLSLVKAVEHGCALMCVFHILGAWRLYETTKDRFERKCPVRLSLRPCRHGDECRRQFCAYAQYVTFIKLFWNSSTSLLTHMCSLRQQQTTKLVFAFTANYYSSSKGTSFFSSMLFCCVMFCVHAQCLLFIYFLFWCVSGNVTALLTGLAYVL